MTPEQQAAYIMSQVACVMVEIEAMKVENTMAISSNVMPPHSGEDFRNVPTRLGIHHNDVLGVFQGR